MHYRLWGQIVIDPLISCNIMQTKDALRAFPRLGCTIKAGQSPWPQQPPHPKSGFADRRLQD